MTPGTYLGRIVALAARMQSGRLTPAEWLELSVEDRLTAARVARGIDRAVRS